MFKIILDERNGVDVRLERGSYTLEIPPDGILRIKSFEPFDAWHEVTAAYKNEKRLVCPATWQMTQWLCAILEPTKGLVARL